MICGLGDVYKRQCDDRTSPGRRSCDLVAARVWPAIKLGAGSRVPSSAGSSGRQTSCRLNATCTCEFSDVLNARLFQNSTSFGDVELVSKVFRETVKIDVDLR